MKHTSIARADFGSIRHLMRRFFRSLGGSVPSADDERWALAHLLPGERALWKRMSAADRRHALEVARRSQSLLTAAGLEPRREVLAAALLHDVGKVESRLGTFARVATTLVAIALGGGRLIGPRSRPVAGARVAGPGHAHTPGEAAADVNAVDPGGSHAKRERSTRVRRDLFAGARLYLIHDRIGGELLRAAGSDPFTIAWAEQHHLAPSRWTVDREVGALLRAGDGV